MKGSGSGGNCEFLRRGFGGGSEKNGVIKGNAWVQRQASDNDECTEG